MIFAMPECPNVLITTVYSLIQQIVNCPRSVILHTGSLKCNSGQGRQTWAYNDKICLLTDCMEKKNLLLSFLFSPPKKKIRGIRAFFISSE